MKPRYEDTENPTKSLTRAGWKVQLVKAYFDQHGLTKKNAKEAKEMLLRWGWTLRTSSKDTKTEVLDANGAVILSFESEERLEV